MNGFIIGHNNINHHHYCRKKTHTENIFLRRKNKWNKIEVFFVANGCAWRISWNVKKNCTLLKRRRRRKNNICNQSFSTWNSCEEFVFLIFQLVIHVSRTSFGFAEVSTGNKYFVLIELIAYISHENIIMNLFKMCHLAQYNFCN